MTKVNLDQNLVDLDGQPIKVDEKPFLVGMVLANCLMQGKPEDVKNAVAAYMLGEKLKKGGDIELSPEEVTRLHKAIIASTYNTLIAGQLLIILEAKP